MRDTYNLLVSRTGYCLELATSLKLVLMTSVQCDPFSGGKIFGHLHLEQHSNNFAENAFWTGILPVARSAGRLEFLVTVGDREIAIIRPG